MAAKGGAAGWPRSVTFLAGIGGFVLIAAVLYLAQAILIPVALAVLVTFLLTPFVIRLQRLGLPKAAAVPIVVMASFALLGGIGWVVTSQVVRLTDELPRHQTVIVAKVDRLLSLLQEDKGEPREGTFGGLLQAIRARIEDKTEPDKGVFGLDPITVRVEEKDDLPATLGTYLGPLVAPLATAGLVVVLVIFMLFKREDLQNRIVTLSGRAHLAVTTKALDDAGQRIARYLVMQLVINVAHGTAIAIGLFLLDVPYAALWGATSALLRYVPYLGPSVAATLPIAYSFLTGPNWGAPFGYWGQPLAVVGLVVVLELLTNNVMEPLLYGRGVGVSEVAVILAAIVWGWLWGPIGLVLATPITACLVVAGRYVPALSIFNRILGDAPEVESHVVYYQRLLARDEDEAEELFDDEVARGGLTEACASVLIPTLESTKRDRMRGLLEPDQVAYILDSVAEHVEEAPAPTPEAGQDAEPPAVGESPGEQDLRPLVLGYAVRDAEDDAALRILARLISAAPCRFEMVSRNVLLSELVAELRERRPAGLCLIGLPPGGMTHTRSFLKRLRVALPDLVVTVARWGESVPDRHRAALQEQGGATYVGRTPAETVQQVVSMGRLRPAGPTTEKEAAVLSAT